jgi:TonB family protein
MVRLLIAILGAVLPVRANAECTIDPARMNFSLSSESLAIRNTMFLQLCASAGGELVDITDPTLVGRLEWNPRSLSLPHGDYYPTDAKRRGWQGTVVLAILVDVDGSVYQPTVLVSSGHRVLDQAALEFWGKVKFTSPARLDGRPVRALVYRKMPFKIR